MSRLPATEVFSSSAAAWENVCGESNTIAFIYRGVGGGGPSLLSQKPRDDDFDSADERGMETLLEYYRERLVSTEVGPKKFHHGPR